jgi:hypothetical protein
VPLVSTAVRSKRVKTLEFYSNTAGGNYARKFLAQVNQVEVMGRKHATPPFLSSFLRQLRKASQVPGGCA